MPKEKLIIPADKLENIILESNIASQFQYSNTFLRLYDKKGYISITDSIVKKYGYTHAQYDTTLSAYSANPEKLDEIYERVLVRLIEYDDKMKADNMKEEEKEKLKEAEKQKKDSIRR